MRNVSGQGYRLGVERYGMVEYCGCPVGRETVGDIEHQEWIDARERSRREDH